MWRPLVIGVAAGIWVAPVALGEVWHVDSEVAVAGDGRSWAGAFRHLQDALTHGELAAGDEIWVAAGAYYPDRTAGKICAPSLPSDGNTLPTLSGIDVRDLDGSTFMISVSPNSPIKTAT